jgi:1-acyl-sn-glycerol-3-phosphate acyltransferase
MFVDDWTTLKTLAPGQQLEEFARRHPTFFSRYIGEEDEFGFSLETFAVWEPFFRFCYEDYFKVKVYGLENIPSEGKALIVGNHSGLLPLDGAMLSMSMCNEHPSPRRIRFLATDWFFNIPGIGPWILATGQVRATLENAQKLLERGEIVGLYPEGLRGVGKTFRERYRLHDFHPGFVQLAISTQTKLIPIATVGGDEIFPNFVNVKKFAQIIKMPFFPVTHGFPWLPFPLNFIPLPARWLMKINKPIDLGYPPEKASDRKLVHRIAREIQYDIQRQLNQLLAERKEMFTEAD